MDSMADTHTNHRNHQMEPLHLCSHRLSAPNLPLPPPPLVECTVPSLFFSHLAFPPKQPTIKNSPDSSLWMDYMAIKTCNTSYNQTAKKQWGDRTFDKRGKTKERLGALNWWKHGWKGFIWWLRWVVCVSAMYCRWCFVLFCARRGRESVGSEFDLRLFCDVSVSCLLYLLFPLPFPHPDDTRTPPELTQKRTLNVNYCWYSQRVLSEFWVNLECMGI